MTVPSYECEDCIGMKEHGCYCAAHGATAPGGNGGRWMCPVCDGQGELIKNWDRYLQGESIEPEVICECPNCDGTGWCEAAVLS